MEQARDFATTSSNEPAIALYIDRVSQDALTPEQLISAAKGLCDVAGDKEAEHGDIVDTAKQQFEDLVRSKPLLRSVAFVSDASQRVHMTTTQLGVPTGCRVQSTPYLRPLLRLEALQDPVGVAVLARDRVKFAQWSPGGMHLVEDHQFELVGTHWRRLEGPSAGPSGRAAGQPERFQNRKDEATSRQFRGLSHVFDELAAQYGWEKRVVVGDSPVTLDFLRRCSLASRAQVVAQIEGVHINTPLPELNEVVTPHLLARHQEGQRDMLRMWKRRRCRLPKTDDEAKRMKGFLTEGRVARLLVPLDDGAACSTVEYDVLVQQALQQGASVSVMTGDNAAELDRSGGLGALLRY